MVVDDVEHRSTMDAEKPAPSACADVAVVQMQPARAKDLGREVELLFASRR